MIKKKSYFKNPETDILWFENWVKQIETLNTKTYERITLNTQLGKTHIWGLNTADTSLETLVIFPGFRTSTLFWDLDNGLDQLGKKLRIFMVETNGQPNLSDGNSPSIRSNDYGIWAKEVLEKLNIEQTFIAGASFGGLVCMKLCLVSPEKIKAAFLLNAGCFQMFSLKFRNLYYNLLPLIFPNEKNIRKFLDAVIFCKPNHQLSPAAEKLLIDYEVYVLKQYKDRTQKPYYLNKELDGIKTDTYLLESDKDILFPYKKSISNARKHISSLKDVQVFANVGHGIETYGKAIKFMGQLIDTYH